METFTIKSPIGFSIEIPIKDLFKIEQSIVSDGRYKNRKLDKIISDAIDSLDVKLTKDERINMTNLLLNYAGYFYSFLSHTPHKIKAIKYYKKYVDLRLTDNEIHSFIMDKVLLHRSVNEISDMITDIIYKDLSENDYNIIHSKLVTDRTLLSHVTEYEISDFMRHLYTIKDILND